MSTLPPIGREVKCTVAPTRHPHQKPVEHLPLSGTKLSFPTSFTVRLWNFLLFNKLTGFLVVRAYFWLIDTTVMHKHFFRPKYTT